MFAKAKAAAASAALAAKAAAEDADRRYGISDAVAGATEVASAQAAAVAERVDIDSTRAYLQQQRENAVRATTKATAFLEESLAAEVDLCYVAPRIVAMGMPGEPPNTLERLSRELHTKHGTHFMVWNLSEVSYDYTAFNDQVRPASASGCCVSLFAWVCSCARPFTLYSVGVSVVLAN